MKKIIYMIAAIWSIIVFLFVFFNEPVLFSSNEVILKAAPVDPRDLLRGDYVTLNFEISDFKDKNRIIKDRKENKTVYVLLENDSQNIAHAAGITDKKPDSGIFIKGKLKKSGFRKYRIKYGIESYFVKEKTGRELENNLRNGAFIKVKINKDGFAKISGFVM